VIGLLLPLFRHNKDIYWLAGPIGMAKGASKPKKVGN
jgi:hypothetical protein